MTFYPRPNYVMDSHGNLTLNNFVKATIFVDMIVQTGCINSYALKSILKYCTNTPSAITLLLFIP
jgi:hypothetical protein